MVLLNLAHRASLGVHVDLCKSWTLSRESVLPMKDGLLKLKDFPAEAGGSGETVSE